MQEVLEGLRMMSRILPVCGCYSSIIPGILLYVPFRRHATIRFVPFRRLGVAME